MLYLQTWGMFAFHIYKNMETDDHTVNIYKQ